MTIYQVWSPERGGSREESTRVKAINHADAAERWAEWDDAHSADYNIVGGNPAEVCVAEDFAGSEVRRFSVSGESCPVYHARAGVPHYRENGRSTAGK